MPKSPLTLASSLLAVFLVATGCTSYDTVNLDGNAKGYHIYCSGLPYAAESDCNRRAMDLCDDEGGYTVLSDSTPASPHNQTVWDYSTRHLFVRCNAAGTHQADSNASIDFH